MLEAVTLTGQIISVALGRIRCPSFIYYFRPGRYTRLFHICYAFERFVGSVLFVFSYGFLFLGRVADGCYSTQWGECLVGAFAHWGVSLAE